MIDWKNPAGWKKYAEETDKIAEEIKEAVKNPNLNIDDGAQSLG